MHWNKNSRIYDCTKGQTTLKKASFNPIPSVLRSPLLINEVRPPLLSSCGTREALQLCTDIWKDMFVHRTSPGRRKFSGRLSSMHFCGQPQAFRKTKLFQLNPFDLVVLLTLSNTVQNAINWRRQQLLAGIIGAIPCWSPLSRRSLLYDHSRSTSCRSRADVLVEVESPHQR